MTVPERIRNRMKLAGEEGPREGVKIAQELLKEIRHICDGTYLMPPFNKFEMAVEIVQVL